MHCQCIRQEYVTSSYHTSANIIQMVINVLEKKSTSYRVYTVWLTEIARIGTLMLDSMQSSIATVSCNIIFARVHQWSPHSNAVFTKIIIILVTCHPQSHGVPKML